MPRPHLSERLIPHILKRALPPITKITIPSPTFFRKCGTTIPSQHNARLPGSPRQSYFTHIWILIPTIFGGTAVQWAGTKRYVPWRFDPLLSLQCQLDGKISRQTLIKNSKNVQHIVSPRKKKSLQCPDWKKKNQSMAKHFKHEGKPIGLCHFQQEKNARSWEQPPALFWQSCHFK